MGCERPSVWVFLLVTALGSRPDWYITMAFG